MAMLSSSLTRRRTYNLLFALAVVVLTWQVLERTIPVGKIWHDPTPILSGQQSQYIDHVGVSDLFDWSRLPQRYPLKEFAPIPSNPGRSGIPKIQALFFTKKDGVARQTQQQRLESVKREFIHAYNGYRMKAWLKDEVGPISGGFRNPFGGWGATLVDSLGTLWVMGMENEFDEAVGAASSINFSKCNLEEVNVFETTIRYLGGFLSAYDLSKGKYVVLLQKAVELGEMLYHAFDTPNRMPVMRWEWEAKMRGEKQQASSNTLLAEIGSLTLEFTRLSQVTGDPKYYDAVQRIMTIFEEQQDHTKLPGMWPVIVDAKSKDFTAFNGFTIGGMADSAYEYLPKQHLLLNGNGSKYETMYTKSLATMKKHIFYRPMTPSGLDILLAGQADSDGYKGPTSVQAEPQAQHLACFAGGMVGLGAKMFSSTEDLNIAKKLVEGCLWAYESATLGIMPEIMHTLPCPDEECRWDEELWHKELIKNHPEEASTNAEDIIQNRHLPPGVVRIDDGRYILRPEAIESVFYLYRMTGDTNLQERAWKMFETIIKHTRTNLAHAALDDCTVPKPPKADSMESFWLAETLRYFYLIFADEDLVSLDEFVFNTEAHPLKRPE